MPSGVIAFSQQARLQLSASLAVAIITACCPLYVCMHGSEGAQSVRHGRMAFPRYMLANVMYGAPSSPPLRLLLRGGSENGEHQEMGITGVLPATNHTPGNATSRHPPVQVELNVASNNTARNPNVKPELNTTRTSVQQPVTRGRSGISTSVITGASASGAVIAGLTGRPPTRPNVPRSGACALVHTGVSVQASIRPGFWRLESRMNSTVVLLFLLVFVWSKHGFCPLSLKEMHENASLLERP
jgi:hypothetical protein